MAIRDVSDEQTRLRAFFLWKNRTGKAWWDATSNWLEAEQHAHLQEDHFGTDTAINDEKSFASGPMTISATRSPLKVDLEERIGAFGWNKMRFFVSSPLNDCADLIPLYFPQGSTPPSLSDVPALSPWPWDLMSDPFVEVSSRVDAMRASYLAPAIHLNAYIDWMTFDTECELGLHSVMDNENRPSNVARRAYIEGFVHSALISLKSGLDRLISVLACYYPGIASHTTWGRIEAGKPKGFMATVERGRQTDELLEYLSNEYGKWIAAAVAPRDDVIHYTDLQTVWSFRSNGDGEDLNRTGFRGGHRV